MGKHSEMFLDCRMSEQDYKEIDPELRERIEIRLIDSKDIIYTDNDLWLAQKKKSDKEFKALKKIEFNIRHNK